MTAVEADFIEGATEGGLSVRIGATEVREIRKREGAPGKAAGLGVGLALALFVGALSQGAVGPW